MSGYHGNHKIAQKCSLHYVTVEIFIYDAVILLGLLHLDIYEDLHYTI